MSTVEEIEQQIKKLPQEEFAKLRRWIAEVDAEIWDAQIEADIRAGRLDEMGNQAMAAHAAGRSIEL